MMDTTLNLCRIDISCGALSRKKKLKLVYRNNSYFKMNWRDAGPVAVLCISVGIRFRSPVYIALYNFRRIYEVMF